MIKLITLKPLKPYFFGGEITFSDDSYIAYSRKLPQQTTLLGMLRKTLLLQNHLLRRKKERYWINEKNDKKVKDLVGDTAFDLIKQNRELNLGVIKRISPLFLVKNGKKYFKRLNLDDFEYKNEILWKKNKKEKRPYNPKNDNKELWGYFFSKYDKIEESKIFESVEQIGIQKNSKQDGYYKKISCKLKGFEFGFLVEFDEEKLNKFEDFTFKNDIVELGGERSAFKMNISDENEWLDYDEFKEHSFISDVYCEEPLKGGNVDFAITKAIPFGYLYTKRKKDKLLFVKKDKIYIYEKGSVLFNPKDNLLSHINSFRNLQKIGMNIIKE
jgi:CRISPR-associated protein Cmr3